MEQKQLVGLTPLLLLTQDGATRALLERAITVLENARKLETLAILELLAQQVFKNDPTMLVWIEWRFENMQDFLIENTSIYKKLVKRGEIKGIEKGVRQSIGTVVQARFPDLLDLARERVAHIQDEEQLHQILTTLAKTPTEGEAHRFLMTLPAGSV